MQNLKLKRSDALTLTAPTQTDTPRCDQTLNAAAHDVYSLTGRWRRAASPGKTKMRQNVVADHLTQTVGSDLEVVFTLYQSFPA